MSSDGNNGISIRTRDVVPTKGPKHVFVRLDVLIARHGVSVHVDRHSTRARAADAASLEVHAIGGTRLELDGLDQGQAGVAGGEVDSARHTVRTGSVAGERRR